MNTKIIHAKVVVGSRIQPITVGFVFLVQDPQFATQCQSFHVLMLQMAPLLTYTTK